MEQKNDGNVKFQMDWASYQWRDTHEATEPEFEIKAEGHSTKPEIVYQPKSVRVAFKVKFIRVCILDVPAAA